MPRKQHPAGFKALLTIFAERITYLEKLPVYEVLEDVRESLTRHNTVILQAPPGAGKSTVLPLELLSQPWLERKKIILLEPRRLAARAVAWRMSDQLGEEPGQTVGYRVRFESKVSASTRIEVVTEGILTRMLQHDNALEGVGLLIFDEFHERSLHADLALALSRESQQVLRSDLRILVMSATLDGPELSQALGQPPLIVSKGRQFPVEYHYHEPDNTKTIAQNTCRLVMKAMREQPKGDVLVFLPGSGDIRQAEELLQESGSGAIVCPLYGDLPHHDQQRALEPDPSGYRKIVLATSIAETSLTINGVSVVVDSGYSRTPRYDLNTGLTKLETVRSTRDTADQRAGRAGRLGPGVCYRMWPERTHHQLAPQRKPEILQADLAQLTLELAGWGHIDPSALSWVTTPPSSSIQQARQLLESLEAVKDGRITPQGKDLLELPIHPRIGHLLLEGKRTGVPALAADVAALLEERDPLRNQESADLTLRLEQLRRWRNKESTSASRNSLEQIDRTARQLRKSLRADKDQREVDHYDTGRLVAAAFPERIARKEDTHGRYRMANGRAARIRETDALIHEDWLAIAQLDAGSGEGKVFLAAAFDESEIIRNISPVEIIQWDDRSDMILARNEWRIGNLVARSEPLQKPPLGKVALAVCNHISRNGLHLFDRTDTTDQLQARVQSLRKWRPELELPDFSDEQLLENCPLWAEPFVGSVRRKEDLKRLDLLQMLLSQLTWEQQQTLNRLATEKMEVPSGSMIPIRYSLDGGDPVLAVRLQEVFGLTESPAVNDGKTRLVLHLLSPGYKPVQVTKDLQSFWKTTYHEVRKELKIRYPKHSWPEDPWTATAVRGAVRRRS